MQTENPAPATTTPDPEDRFFEFRRAPGSTMANYSMNLGTADMVNITVLMAQMLTEDLASKPDCKCRTCQKARDIIAAVSMPTAQGETVQ